MSSKKSAFQKNKYSILRGVISKELADFAYTYFLNKISHDLVIFVREVSDWF